MTSGMPTEPCLCAEAHTARRGSRPGSSLSAVAQIACRGSRPPDEGAFKCARVAFFRRFFVFLFFFWGNEAEFDSVTDRVSVSRGIFFHAER